MGSDSEDDENEFEGQSSDVEAEEEVDIEEDLLETIEQATSEASDHEDYSDEDDDEDEDDEEPPPSQQPPPQHAPSARPTVPTPASQTVSPVDPTSRATLSNTPKAPSPIPAFPRPLSPATLRRTGILSSVIHPKNYTVEAICAIPHPVATHSLAGSLCFTHCFTGSEDGYVRDYDIFAAVNGKNVLTTAQRSHCGVVEGTMKSGQIRYWWENPADIPPPELNIPMEEIPLAPIYSMASHSDALWLLTGSIADRINLFTARHEPGRLIHSFVAHKGPISSLSLTLDETGFFSGGWDGSTHQWDLNTGQKVRSYTAHGAQISAVAVRPMAPPSIPRSPSPMDVTPATVHINGNGNATTKPHDSKTSVPSSGQQPQMQPKQEDITMQSDTRSDTSYDDLFDEPDGDAELNLLGPGESLDQPSSSFSIAMPGSSSSSSAWLSSQNATVAAPENAPPVMPVPVRQVLPQQPVKLAPKMPPLLDASNSPEMSPDLLMTASIDGQIVLWDRRVSAQNGAGSNGVGRLTMNSGTPPWCVSACWSATGMQMYAGRRNGTIDVWDVRYLGTTSPKSTPRLLKTIRNPASSGMVACVVAFPDGKHLACASNDNIRLWNVAEAGENTGRGAQFKIIPGHHGGFVSQMLVDPAARFLVSASSDRGWEWGTSSRTVFVHDIKHNH